MTSCPAVVTAAVWDLGERKTYSEPTWGQQQYMPRSHQSQRRTRASYHHCSQRRVALPPSSLTPGALSGMLFLHDFRYALPLQDVTSTGNKYCHLRRFDTPQLGALL